LEELVDFTTKRPIMNVVILAAGYGTRLYPLTLKIAKPLILVGDTPIINFLIKKIDNLKKYFSIKEVRIVVNDKFYKSFLSWKKKYKVDAKIINDGSFHPDNRLGAIKDMKIGINRSGSDFLVLGGDNLFKDELVKFIDFSVKKRPYPSIGTYDVQDKETAKRFGIVILNSQKRVVRLDEKPNNPLSTLAASCVYFFPKESLKFINLFIKQNKNVDASGKYISWLAKECQVYGYPLKGAWVDVGHFTSLKEAKKIFKQ